MLVALAVGLASGWALYGSTNPNTAIALGAAQAVGQLWLDGLTMTVVPLIFALIVTGIATAARIGATSVIGWRTLRGSRSF
jgi:Na+/H+-dicarboxylate symporter